MGKKSCYADKNCVPTSARWNYTEGMLRTKLPSEGPNANVPTNATREICLHAGGNLDCVCADMCRGVPEHKWKRTDVPRNPFCRTPMNLQRACYGTGTFFLVFLAALAMCLV